MRYLLITMLVILAYQARAYEVCPHNPDMIVSDFGGRISCWDRDALNDAINEKTTPEPWVDNYEADCFERGECTDE